MPFQGLFSVYWNLQLFLKSYLTILPGRSLLGHFLLHSDNYLLVVQPWWKCVHKSTKFSQNCPYTWDVKSLRLIVSAKSSLGEYCTKTRLTWTIYFDDFLILFFKAINMDTQPTRSFIFIWTTSQPHLPFNATFILHIQNQILLSNLL